MRWNPRSNVRVGLTLAALSWSIMAGPARADAGKEPPRTLESEPNPAKRQSAEEHIRVGMIAFEKRNYTLAVTELRAAYADVPDPSFLYALGQAYRMSGDCARAREAYRAFLETSPTEKQRDAAIANIERCDAAPATKTTAPAPPATHPTAEAAATTPASSGAEARPPAREAWYLDVPGGVLTGGGVVAIVAGAVVYGGGRSKVAEADAASDDGAFANNRADADAGLTEQRVGLVVMGVGAALVTAGVLRYVSVAKRSSSVQVGLTFGGIAASGTF